MKKIALLLAIIVVTLPACSQQSSNKPKTNSDVKVGGACEGCEAIFESPVDFDQLTNMVHLPDWEDKGTKLAVNGTVYNPNGSPAAGVIIYIYHTDQKGEYPTRGNEKGWAKRHGYLRGWMKTNEKGEYKFFTLRPASYPNSRNPQHIHVIIKEPGKTPYWVDEYLFDDDPFLTDKERNNAENRGGNGIIKTKDVGNMLKSERNIYLGKNIPAYPKQ